MPPHFDFSLFFPSPSFYPKETDHSICWTTSFHSSMYLMYRVGSDGWEKKGVISRKQEGVWTDSDLYLWLELNTASCTRWVWTALLSQLCRLYCCIYIHHCARVDNQSNLPLQRETELCGWLRDACLSIWFEQCTELAKKKTTHHQRTSTFQTTRLHVLKSRLAQKEQLPQLVTMICWSKKNGTNIFT